MANLEAAQTSDRRKALEAVRDTLAVAIDRAAERGDGTVAQLVAQYRATLSELDALGDPEVSESDRIRSELAAGLADADVVQLAGRRRQHRAG